jgi:hypothetical protein
MTTTQIFLWFIRNDNSILVNPNIGAQNRPFYHAVLILQNRGNTHRCSMFKVTHLVDPRRKVGTPRTLGLESPQTLGLESPLRQPRHSVTYHEANISNQSIKYNKQVLYECTKRKRE